MRTLQRLSWFLPLVALAACGRKASAPATPEPGGTLRIAVFEALEPLSPVLANQATTTQFLEHVTPPLGSLDERGTVRLRLARDYVDLGGQVDFILRRLRWDDGVPVTASDLVWTATLLGDYRIRSPDRARVEMLRNAVALDDTTLRLEYRTLYSRRVRDALLMPMPVHADVPGADRRDLGSWPLIRQPLSCGPFRVRAASGRGLVLERNTVSGFEPAPFLDAVEVRVLDIDAAIDSFGAGSLDVLDNVPAHRLNDARKRRGARTVALVGRSYVFMGWNLRDARFGDIAVRRAAAHAVDMPALIRDLTFGQGEPARGPLVPALDYTDTTQVFAHDLPRARSLLDTAGWRDTDGDGVRERRGALLSFHILVPEEDPWRVEVAQRVARDLARIGMRAAVRALPLQGLLTRLGSASFEAYVGEWYPDVGLDLDDVWRSDVPDRLNFGGYANLGVDSLLTRMRHERSAEERADVLYRFQIRVYADQPYLFLFLKPRFLVLSERVRGAEPTVLSSFDNLPEWWIPRSRRSP